MKMLCWNVDGLRSVLKKGFVEWLLKESPDVLCLQETRLSDDEVPEELRHIDGYHSFFSRHETKKGYSGVALFTKKEPVKVEKGFGIPRFDEEGRTLVADYGNFVLMNIYFPNGKASDERLDYKMAFYDAFLAYADGIKKKGKGVIVCGDVNTAHTELDIARPKDNAKRSGFLPMERAWMDKLESHGYVDTYRVFEKEGGHYTYWDMRTGARKRNVGWRIDYFYISEDLLPQLKSAYIESDVTGSDHCPIGIEINL
jgi:exodeoxyribonuclease III